jgi:hypothetical protein
MSIVYVLTNAAMPGFIKIGKTDNENVIVRLAQLYTTGVPFPFELAFACKVANADEVEKALHRAFAPNRVNPNREFFKIEPDQAIVILKLLHVEDATAEIAAQPSTIPAEEVQAAEQYRSRRPPLNFIEMGIPINSELHFTESDATVIVSAAKKVRLGDEEMSLTSATRNLLGIDYDRQPTPLWTYNGRPLTELYDATYL